MEETAGSQAVLFLPHMHTTANACAKGEKKKRLTPVIMIKLLGSLLIIKNLHGSKFSSFLCFVSFGLGEGAFVCLFCEYECFVCIHVCVPYMC